LLVTPHKKPGCNTWRKIKRCGTL